MIVTGTWIDTHRSGGGGWSRAQLAAIGVTWPPQSGWKRRVIGAEITEAQRAVFEGRAAQPEVSPPG